MKGVLVIFTIAFLVLISTWKAEATIGVDFSKEISEGSNSGDYVCLAQNGVSFAVIQTWQGGYCMTNNIAQSVSWSWSAGFAHVDVYIFMCPCCTNNGDAASVVSTVFNSLSSQGVTYGMIWFDIEQCSGCWEDANTNCGYIATAVNEAIGLGAHIGIYSSDYEWGATVGSGCTAFSAYPLWYADWNDQCNFDDSWAYQFGGWSSPAIKQYCDQGPCMSVDLDWYPDSFDEYYRNITTTKQPLIDRNKYAAQFKAYEEFKLGLVNGSMPNAVKHDKQVPQRRRDRRFVIEKK